MQSPTPEHSLPPREIEFRTMRQSDVEASVSLVAHVFSSREPLALILGLSLEHMTALVERLLSTARRERSFVATHAGRVVAVLLNESFDDPEITLPAHLAGDFAPLFDFLGKMDERYFQQSGMNKSKFFHQFIGAVDSDYSNLSISENLINLSNREAKAWGFAHSIAEVTGEISKRVLVHKCGYTEEFSTRFEHIQGKIRAQNMDTTCSLVTKLLF